MDIISPHKDPANILGENDNDDDNGSLCEQSPPPEAALAPGDLTMFTPVISKRRRGLDVVPRAPKRRQ